MGSLEKNILRNEAKKIYKENTKNIPRRNRIPFSEFFKQYRKMKAGQKPQPEQIVAPEPTEDFDFGEMVNVNKDLEVEEAAPPEIVEEKKEEEKKE